MYEELKSPFPHLFHHLKWCICANIYTAASALFPVSPTNSMIIRGSIEIRDVRGIVGKLTAPQSKEGDIICSCHRLLFSSGFKVPRHSSLPEEIRVRRLTEFTDINHSQKNLL